MVRHRTYIWLINLAPKNPNASARAAGCVVENTASQPRRVPEALQGPLNYPLLNMTMYYGSVNPRAQLRNHIFVEKANFEHGVRTGSVGHLGTTQYAAAAGFGNTAKRVPVQTPSRWHRGSMEVKKYASVATETVKLIGERTPGWTTALDAQAFQVHMSVVGISDVDEHTRSER